MESVKDVTPCYACRGTGCKYGNGLGTHCGHCDGRGHVPTQALGKPAPAIHPAPVEFTEEEVRTDDVLHFFHYAHLPEGIFRDTSAHFAKLARVLVDSCPRCPQRTISLNNLLAAKDAAVRTHVRR